MLSTRRDIDKMDYNRPPWKLLTFTVNIDTKGSSEILQRGQNMMIQSWISAASANARRKRVSHVLCVAWQHGPYIAWNLKSQPTPIKWGP